MNHSSRMAFAGLAALLVSSTASIAAPAALPPGQVVSVLSQSQLRSVLRDILSGASDEELRTRYKLTLEQIDLLQNVVQRLDVENLRELQNEVRSIIREIRSGADLDTIRTRLGLGSLSRAELITLARSLSIDVDRLTDRLEKFEQKAERKETRKNGRGDEDETTGNSGGASRFAPGQQKGPGESAREFAPGQRAKDSTMSARDFAPGQQNRTGDDDTTTGSIGAEGRGGNGGPQGSGNSGQGDKASGNGNGGPQGGGPGNSGQGDKASSDHGGGGNGHGGGHGGGRD